MTTPELYDAVAVGGTVATRTRFSVRMLTGNFHVAPRTLLLVTHRSDWDIPLTTNIYWPARLWGRGVKPVFVARDDMFLPGFLAGYPPGLPLALRRLLAPVRVGGVLRSQRLALPIASADRAHLADVVRDDPSRPLAELPEELREAFRARARRLGAPEPKLAADVAGGGYVDLLWRRCERAELPLPDFWARRQAVARRDLQALLDHVAGGGSLVIYPEGRPSPDGALGPIQRGLGLLIRRARPDLLLPLAVAYDPLGPGRTRAYVTVGAAFEPPPPAEAEAAVLDAFRRLFPLTAGQVAAHAALHGLDPELVAAGARDDGRPVEPRLAELLPGAVAAARQAPRHLLERLDREFRSARGL